MTYIVKKQKSLSIGCFIRA